MPARRDARISPAAADSLVARKWRLSQHTPHYISHAFICYVVTCLLEGFVVAGHAWCRVMGETLSCSLPKQPGPPRSDFGEACSWSAPMRCGGNQVPG